MLAAAVQADTIELAEAVGFDIQRHQRQGGAVIRRGLQPRVPHLSVVIDGSIEQNRRGDESFHQVAFRRADIGFIQRDAGVGEDFLRPRQRSVMAAIKPVDRPALEIAQRQRLHVFAGQQRADAVAKRRRNKSHRLLGRKADLLRALIRRQPKIDGAAGGGIPPVAGENKPLLRQGRCGHNVRLSYKRDEGRRAKGHRACGAGIR